MDTKSTIFRYIIEDGHEKYNFIYESVNIICYFYHEHKKKPRILQIP